MKHLKLFEDLSYLEFDPKYKKDEYILLSTLGSMFYDIYKNYGKILKVFGGRSSWMYDVRYVNKNTFTFDEMTEYILENHIIRKLTQEEIKDFEIKMYTNKYNI